MKRIKIAFIIDTIHDKIGGTERQLILLLQNIDRSKFEPYLCCFKNSDWIQENSKNWKTHIFEFKSFFSPLDYWRLFRFSRYLKHENIDIIQTHFRDGNILGILAAKMAGIKLIISTRRNQGYWHNKTELFVLKLLNPFVKRFLANSNAVKIFVNKVEKISLDRIDVIYNGFDLSKFSGQIEKNTPSIRDELNIESNKSIISVVANLRPVKGLDILIQSAQKVLIHNEWIEFLLIGDGPEKKKLQEMAEELKISKNIHFLGSRNDVHEILKSSTIGVLCSHSEGLSNSIIEYMASGLPVVATDVGGNRELITDGENGHLVEPKDADGLASAIIEILDHDDKLIKMGQVSLEKAKINFEMDHIVSETGNYYETLVKL